MRIAGLLVVVVSALLVNSLHAAAIFAPGNPILGGQSDGTNFNVGLTGVTAGANNWPASEGPERAIDGAGQKYINFAEFNTGILVTPAASSVARSILLWTANDAEPRDPTGYALYGTNAAVSGGGPFALANFSLISAGALSLPSSRNAGGAAPLQPQNLQVVSFANAASYASYLVLFPSVKAPPAANSMQIAEVQLDTTGIPDFDFFAGEPFDYAPPGADLLGQDGGVGFDGPWIPSGFNASVRDNFDIAAGSLSFAELAVTSNRVGSLSTAAIAGLGRNLRAPVAAGAASTLFLSLLLRPEGVLGEGAFNGFFGVYLDGTGNADLFVGKPGGAAAANYAIENRGGSGQVLSSTTPVVGETVFLVVRCDLRPGADLFTLYVNPLPCGGEPAAGIQKSDLDLGEVSALVIYSTGAFSLDELRLGASFEDVARAGDIDCRPAGGQIPSDCNQDGHLDLSDAVCLFGFLFLGNPTQLSCDDGLARDPGNIALLDANGDAQIDLSDGVHVLSFLFGGCSSQCPPPVLGTRCVRIVGCPMRCTSSP
jgi:hypothetical protein